MLCHLPFLLYKLIKRYRFCEGINRCFMLFLYNRVSFNTDKNGFAPIKLTNILKVPISTLRLF